MVRPASRVSLLRVFMVLALLFSLQHSEARGDTANYYYDKLGQLSRVVRGTEGAVYRYDELGNLLSVTSGAISTAPPVLDNVQPNVLFVNSTLFVKIAGQNLLTTESVVSDNPSLSINNLVITDTEIMAEMTATDSGSATITVTTSYGAANIGLTLSDSILSFSPGQLSIIPGTDGILSVSVSPPLGVPLTVNLKNSDPDVVTAPVTLTIPIAGTADFTVNGLAEGAATVSSGDPRSVVFVTAPLTGDVAGLTSGMVSVYVDAPTSSPSSTIANPVSVYVNTPSEQPASATTNPVSVYLDAPTDAASTTVSVPVSVEIQ